MYDIKKDCVLYANTPHARVELQLTISLQAFAQFDVAVADIYVTLSAVL